MKDLGNYKRLGPPRAGGNQNIGLVSYTDLANIFSAAQSISLATSGIVQTFESTANDAVAGITDHYRRRGTAAGQDGDDLWENQYNGLDDNASPAKTKYARTLAEIVDASDTTEDGRYSIGTMRAGTVVDWVFESGALRYQTQAQPSAAGAVAATAALIGGVQLLPMQMALFQDQKANGTNGGNSVATTWTKRVIGGSTAVFNNVSGLTIGTDVLTFAEAGTYLLAGRMPFEGIQNSSSRLQRTNNTPTTIQIGSNTDPGASLVMTDSWVMLPYTATAGDTIEFQYWAPTATANGLGTAVTNGIAEVYAQLVVLRLA